MKTAKLLRWSTLHLCFALFFWSCGGNNSAAHEHQQDDKAQTEQKAEKGKEYTSAYVCPMHCEGSGSEEAGKCPACGMDYVAQAEHSKDGHNH
ncbi:heavy metal-binding domain-containing protein [Haliscomenobacter sp.]|uniref:heavy metal-binding domain-containing protein n=1 Tax=Haliscomenobacter sp. TaxID=2717303 RepID=UPI003BA93B10